VPPGEADFLLVIAPDQVDVNRWQLRPGGVLIVPSLIDVRALRNKKSLNVALLGVLSALAGIPEDHWREAIRLHLPEKLHEANFAAFALGRQAAHREFNP
jgi:indolepyruvate ferredoxin oxidoreductase beta subunit